MIDSHCHLDAAEFDEDRDAIHARALKHGVKGIVIPAVERATFGAVSALCRDYACCYPAYGIHPLFVDRAEEEDLQVLREVLTTASYTKQPPVAIGEIGLDHFMPQYDGAKQLYYFTEQLNIAKHLNLPVILHVRKAIDEVLRELRKYKVCGGIAHAFNGSRQQADEFIKLGFKLGFGGAMTWDRALRIRELARTLPLDSIVLETDSPDIPPEWLGDKGRNEPGELPRIASVLANLRNITRAEVEAATSANAHAALQLDRKGF